jgi:hypothetical protein
MWREAVRCRLIDGDLVAAPSNVLDESVTGGEDASRSELLESAHRAKPRFVSTMIGLNRVVRVLVGAMHRGRGQLVENPRVCSRSVRGPFDRDGPGAERMSEERPRRGEVTPMRQPDLDAVRVVDSPV